MEEIVNAISNLGFPVAYTCAMAWYVKYITDKNREEIADLNTKHHEEMETITDAINNNTIALTKLCERLEAN